MSCPTCDHTMQRLEGEWFWCPRCGTVRNRAAGVSPEIPYDDVPKLVGRCRELERGYIPGDEYPPLTAAWRRLGIAESIHLPADRPTPRTP